MELDRAGMEELVQDNILITSVERLLDYCRSYSIWPVTFGLACCALEMMATGGARYDIARFGYEAFRPSPRQADLMIIAGTVTHKMAPIVKRLYDQMPCPKYVIAMGSCAMSGGPFVDSYSVLKGVDKIIPVDIHIPGCPPRPEALLEGLLQIKRMLQSPRKSRGSRV